MHGPCHYGRGDHRDLVGLPHGGGLVSFIFFSVYLAVPVRFGLIHHHLISPVDIVGPVSFRQRRRKQPAAPIQVDETLPGHRIIHIDIGYVIIIDMIIPYRRPLGLGADIDVYLYPHLGVGASPAEESGDN
jgi:hypothetical protein